MTRQAAAGLPFELFLLGVLALLWGSSYLFIKLALWIDEFKSGKAHIVHSP